MKIEYLDGARLRRALVAGCGFVQHRRAELNRINVFPVPDGDTGTNLALTAAAIADGIRSSHDAAVGTVAQRAADAAILGARGNVGMILSHFLIGFAEAVRNRARIGAADFAEALHRAVEHAYRSLERPVEGTIITAMREVAEEARTSRAVDFADLVEGLLVRAKSACDRTPDLLPALRKAGVVDASAKGFVHLMEGMVAYVHGDPFVALDATPVFEQVGAAAGRVEYPVTEETYRFCTEALVRGAALPTEREVRDFLRNRGDSTIVIRGEGVLKIHVHTDEPEQVFRWLRGVGQLVTHKAEDMAAQHATVERAAASHVQLARRPVSIVTDSACDLPIEIVRAHGIRVVPLIVVFDREVLQDGVDIDAPTFVARLKAGEHASTSQPPPRAFLDAFTAAAEDGEAVLGVILGAALSGTYQSAETAARKTEGSRVELVDSAGASLLQGLLVLRAAELAELGRAPEDIAVELRRIRAQSGIMFTVDVFDYLLKSGRVGRGQVMIAGLLDIKPILGVSPEGKVLPAAKVRGRANVLPRMLELLQEKIPRDAKQLRFGVVHVGCPEMIDQVSAALRERFGERETLVGPATPVLATHVGPGAWGVAWQLED
ncbi:MAG: DegV family EDD domain-containing protein [Gemmatimonadetes bacterium]|nr:DegV family EDD domain-containing protein [Gemmatimonadota bacterium]